ncbi:ATP-dependent RNA helicase [Perkinsela sp. CCAP 1560/4]|nr:ATP-dependent RNA helicase [Perkinsela sp. CCAP 1560/4]|eukprot:KNH05759.1 ATP-dependent RNA helicase [Perkinsela sp. CCAP 1560/4]
MKDKTVKRQSKPKSAAGFRSLGLDEQLLKGVDLLKYTSPTPIQEKAIPILLKQQDVLALARTGSGKTAAFLLPMLHILRAHSSVVGIRGLVLSPTRELALQTCRFARSLGKYTDLVYSLIVGGNSLEEQFCGLTKNPDIVVCTPGRLLHIIAETKLELKLARMIVFDEGDRLFEQGFQTQLVEITKLIPGNCTRALFSATLPRSLADFALIGLRQPLLIRLDTETTLSDDLVISFFIIRQDQRLSTIVYLLRSVIKADELGTAPRIETRDGHVSSGNPSGTDRKSVFANQVAIFVPTRYHVEYFHAVLQALGFACSSIHGTMDQEARKEALIEFKQRNTAILVVTDVAARGIDLPYLDFVINAFAPLSEKLFIHRVGRVARAGRTGSAFTLLEITEMPFFAQLKQVLRREFSNEPAGESNWLTSKTNCHYGTVPDLCIKEYIDASLAVQHENPEIHNMQRLADNAMKQYKKTINKPSPTNFSDAKELTSEMLPHPAFEGVVNGAAEKYRSQVSGYRGTGAIFLQKEGIATSSNPQDALALRRFDAFTKKVKERSLAKKLGEEATTIKPTAWEKLTLSEKLLRRGKESQGGGVPESRPKQWCDGRTDAEYFLPYVPTSNTAETGEIRGAQDVSEVTFGLVPDTVEQMQSQRKRKVYMWDNKTKKYKQRSADEAKLLTCGMKNEAGKRIQKIQSNKIYDKWCAQNAIQLQEAGDRESASNVHFKQQPYISEKKFGKKLRGKLLDRHIQEQTHRTERKAAQKQRFLKRH